MNVFAVDVRAVRFTEDSLVFDLDDGRSISAPLSYYPTLLHATEQERRAVEIVGHIVHWPLLDADLSSDCLLRGARELPVYAKRARRRPHARRLESAGV